MTREKRFIRTLQSHRKTYGLEIGSAYTRMLYAEKVIFNQPTCVAVSKVSQEIFAIGEPAYRLLGKNAEQIEVIFPIQVAAPANTSYLANYCLAMAKQLELPTSWIPQLIGNQFFVALPDTLSPIERQLFLQTLHSTHLGNIIPVSASLAAASQLGRLRADDLPVCLIQIGGQTTQMVVISAGKIATARKYPVGGVQFTELVQEVIRQTEHCSISWHLAEKVKREICFVDSPMVGRLVKQKKMSIQGKDLTSQLGKTVVVAGQDIAAEFEPLLSDILINIQLFFSQLPTDLATTALSSGLVFTGGGSLLKGLAEYVSNKFQTEVVVSPSAELDVVKGIATLNGKN
ncbi:MAG: hypothetical protein COY81_04375 [Candidatus Pacebacteria bacterium CG_4_10_14_0_8_um_filter_43_12]|nr:MAG: hypothetical protein COU66_04090 [Candidatus Pacebacteria bacterium CG10_big_fil_rev_8_21_14_0_10_44_11]PIY79121.1 MAG: hypothetical protein COY81_04375 [Candidatus Pacebacteria bacterium CG_4_10_14_0_8_um_filter_43_12]